MDFMQDVLADGRRFRTLNVLDTVTRECLAIEVDTSLPGQRVVRLLEHLILWHGIPKRITLDNGPEFAGQVLDAWAYHHHVTLDFIDPGKPMQNGYLESFKGKFRDECLNIHWFRGLADARRIIEDWRESYNTERPHSALCGHPPAEHALYYQTARSLAKSRIMAGHPMGLRSCH
jgi:putative transposase